MKNIHDILDEKGVFVFECQYLRDIYDKKILGTIFHEHMYHHSISSLSNLFDYFNLNLYDAKLVNIQKGSILGFVTKNKSKNKTKEILKLKNIEEKKQKRFTIIVAIVSLSVVIISALVISL